MDTWITAGVAQGEAGELERIWRTDDRGQAVLAAEGYEFERTCCAPVDDVEWRERVFVVRSPMHANRRAAGLEERLRHAETTLIALTPPRGRGKRRITDEATLVATIDRVLKEHRVAGLLGVTWEKQVEQTTQYVGRGRGSVHREKRVIQKTRYDITHVVRPESPIAALSQRLAGRPLSLMRDERGCLCRMRCCAIATNTAWNAYSHRLKSRVHIAPLFVKLNEQIEGLTYLLTLGVRVLTVTEFVLRRSLEQDQARLPGLHPENKQKMTDKPTAERILQAFADDGFADDHQECCRRGNPAAPDTPVSVTEESCNG